jgi:hypothetical protein
MRKLLPLGAILLLLISCSKEIAEKKEDQTTKNAIEDKSSVNKLNLDSIAKMNAGAFLKSNITQSEIDSIIKISSRLSSKSLTSTTDTIEHYTVSDYIHFVIVSNTTYPTAYNHPSLAVGVPDGYVLVGGGAHAFDNTGSYPIINAGAFLTESRPNGSLTYWKGSSKDHITADPHYLTVYAIGMKIDGVTPAYLRSQISLDSAVSGSTNHPEVDVSVPEGYLLIGGGAFDNYGTGYGNMLVRSYPTSSTTWYVFGKDHRRADPCTITAYAIGINNVSFPNVGYIQTEYIYEEDYVAYGYNEAKTPVSEGWALACCGGNVTYNGIGRLMVSLRPDIPSWGSYDVSLWSGDNGNISAGSNFAYAVRIR